MSDVAEQHQGPIDVTVIGLPDGARHVSDAVARELASLADAELIRVLDLVIVSKDDRGDVTTIEFDQIERPGDLAALRPGLSRILSPTDVGSLAAIVAPGSTAAILVWENTWATHLLLATEESGARLLTSDRIDTTALREARSSERRPEGPHPSP